MARGRRLKKKAKSLSKRAKKRVKKDRETDRSDFTDARREAEKDRIQQEARKEAKKEARQEFRKEERKRLKQEFKEQEKQRLGEAEEEGRDVMAAIQAFISSDTPRQERGAAQQAVSEFQEFEAAFVEEQRERRPSPQADNFGMGSQVGGAGQLDFEPNEFDLDDGDVLR